MSSQVARRRPDPLGKLVYGLVLAYLAGLLLVPLVALVATVAAHAGEVVTQLLEGRALHALAMSLAIGAACVASHAVFGTAAALVLVRHRFPGRRILDAVVDLPLALSPVMTGLAFLLLYGRSGVLRPLTDALGFQVAFAWPGVLLATLFVTLPFTVREVALVLSELGDSEEQAAATLGASPLRTFFRVTLPNIRHGLVVGSTLTLARALGEFGAVLVVGGSIANRTATATTFIHGAVEERHEPAAFGMALLLAGAAVALLMVLARTGRRQR
ncbi:MAG: sulfate ABC transporter permease subunit [Myxococcota bacterium]